MSQIILLAGSPVVPSRTNLVLNYVESLIKKEGFSTNIISVTDFSPEVLAQGKYNDEEIVKFVDAVKEADGVIIGSPVYKASYTGVLKSLMDLLPEGALKNKPVLPIMIGGTARHLLAIEYSLNPLISILKGKPLQGLYFVDGEVDKTNESMPIKDEELLERIQSQITELVISIKRQR